MGGIYNSWNPDYDAYEKLGDGKGLTFDQLRDKYHDLVAQCQYMDGHGGYTGTFAEKPQLKLAPGMWTRDEAKDHCIKNNEKWGPSSAYRLDNGGWYVGCAGAVG